METTKATIQATLLDLLPGSPPTLLYEKATRYKEGSRLFTQQVSVPDTTLFQRLCSMTNKGDEVKITVTTEWHENERIAYISDFELVHKDSCGSIVDVSTAFC